MNFSVKNEESAASFDVKIFDASGHKILEKNRLNQEDSVNVSRLAAGVYFLEVSQHEKTGVRRFVKK